MLPQSRFAKENPHTTSHSHEFTRLRNRGRASLADDPHGVCALNTDPFDCLAFQHSKRVARQESGALSILPRGPMPLGFVSTVPPDAAPDATLRKRERAYDMPLEVPRQRGPFYSVGLAEFRSAEGSLSRWRESLSSCCLSAGGGRSLRCFYPETRFSIRLASWLRDCLD